MDFENVTEDPPDSNLTSPQALGAEIADREDVAFNLDEDAAPTHLDPPLSSLETLANAQRIISQLESASFDDEEDQWRSDEFQVFLHPLQEQFTLDDPHLRLSLEIFVGLSAHSSEESFKVGVLRSGRRIRYDLFIHNI